MKTKILLTLSVFAIFGAQAQSKKKILNHQLRVELIAAENTYDSIYAAHNSNKREIAYLHSWISILESSLLDQIQKERTLRSDIKRKHTLLSELNFDANTIIPLAEVDSMKFQVDFQTVPGKPDNPLYAVNEMQDISEEKLKVQNEMLKLRLDEIVSSNDRNKRILAEDHKWVDELTVVKNKYDKLFKNYEVFNSSLSIIDYTVDRKYNEVRWKKQEEERLKEEKALAAANKKNKKKTVQFEPPVIIDQPYYEKDGTSDINVSSDWGDDFAVPPPPPPIQEPKVVPEVFSVVDETADFPGGMVKLKEYLKENLRMPEVAKELGISGKAYLKFVVSSTGSISDVKVVRGVADCKECDAEAIRLVKSMPTWIPGKNNGKAVSMYYMLTIPFKAD